MADVIVRRNEACEADPFLLWDSVWQPHQGLADWALADSDEMLNHGGLRARQGLATAVTLCLFTDQRVPETHPLFWLADGDPRGWWGDGVDLRDDLGETALGSLLWLLRRAPLTIDGLSASYWAEQLALEALQPLKDQQAVSRVTASATVNETRNRLDLTIELYGRDGARVYDRKFDLLWNQVTTG